MLVERMLSKDGLGGLKDSFSNSQGFQKKASSRQATRVNMLGKKGLRVLASAFCRCLQARAALLTVVPIFTTHTELKGTK
jgi:hypothetical protein